MARKKRGQGVVLDSFLDIMTCMLGVLMLIILLTGVDAAQIKVLIPTPIAHSSDKKQLFIECREDQLFLVPVAELRQLAQKELNDISQEAGGDMTQLLSRLAESSARTAEYKVDLTYALLGKFAIVSLPGAKGYRLLDTSKEKATDWYGRILTTLDGEKEMLTFLVRDDSFTVFKRARGLAWARKIEVSYELLDSEEPVKFGLGGSRSLAQ